MEEGKSSSFRDKWTRCCVYFLCTPFTISIFHLIFGEFVSDSGIFCSQFFFIGQENYEEGDSLWKANADVNPNIGTVVPFPDGACL